MAETKSFTQAYIHSPGAGDTVCAMRVCYVLHILPALANYRIMPTGLFVLFFFFKSLDGGAGHLRPGLLLKFVSKSGAVKAMGCGISEVLVYFPSRRPFVFGGEKNLGR